MIDSEKLKEYISLGETSGFYGYGKWSSDIYIIGIEEAGCYSENLIQQKIDKYFSLSYGDDGLFNNLSFQGDLQDICDPLLTNYVDFFNGRIKKGGYVPKIATLLRILENSNLDLYEYVGKNFGATHSNHSLIEIFPLPCPKVSSWEYPLWVNTNELTFIKNKNEYKKQIISRRKLFIKSKINDTKEKKMILFFANGKEKIKYWNEISPILISNYQKNITDSIPYHIDNNKMYVVLPFPGAKKSNGIFNSKDEIESIGKKIKDIFEKL